MKSVTNEFICVCKEFENNYPKCELTLLERLEKLGSEIDLNLQRFYEFWKHQVPPLSKVSVSMMINKILFKLMKTEVYDIISLSSDMIFLYVVGKIILETI